MVESTGLWRLSCPKKVAHPGDFFPSSQLRRKKCMYWEVSQALWKREGRLNRCDFVSAFDWPGQSVLSGKVSVTKCKSIRSFLMKNAFAIQWYMFGSSCTSFYLRYSIWRTNGWGTSRLCGWIVINPTQEQAERCLNWQCWYQTRYQHGRVWC